MWNIWCKALGQKASSCDKESDKVAIIRTIILLAYMATNVFIVAGVVKHWDSKPCPDLYYTVEITKK